MKKKICERIFSSSHGGYGIGSCGGNSDTGSTGGRRSERNREHRRRCIRGRNYNNFYLELTSADNPYLLYLNRRVL